MGEGAPGRRASRRGARRPQGRPRLEAALALLLLAGCSARSLPLTPPAEGAGPAVAPLPAVVGVVRGEDGPGVARIAPGAVVERFAARLHESGLFRGVVHPVSELAAVRPELLIAVSVSSRYERHALRNLASDLAVGASLLLLQPLLPSRADLALELSLAARSADGRALLEDRVSTETRFESTWLRTPEAEIARWHAETVELAIDAALARLRADRERLAAAPDAR